MNHINLESQIAIVGAGIGGLSSALALVKRGARNVRIFERRKASDEKGAGMQLGPNASRILCKWGLSDEIEAIADRFPVGHLYSGITNQEIATLPMDASAYKRHGFHNYQVLRTDFHNMLLRSLTDTLGENPVQHGKALIDLSRAKKQTTLIFDDHSNYSADLVIAADGTRSAARRLLNFQETELSYSGYFAWRGLLSAEKVPAGNSIEGPRVWVGEGRHLVAYPVGKGRYINLVGVSESPDWTAPNPVQEAMPEAWMQDYAGWCDNTASAPLVLVNALQNCQKWALYSLPAMGSWNSSAVGLLGDAAHPMMPSLAQGAAQAMEDADALAELVGDVQEYSAENLWSHFYASRSSRVKRIQQASLWNLRYFHRKNSNYRKLEQLSMKIGGSFTTEVIARRNDWVYR